MARKTTTIVRCDNPTCKEVGEIEDLKNTPPGWYRIGQADDNEKIQPVAGSFDVCSLRCMEKWAKERRLALDGNGHKRTGGPGTARDNWKCPVCDRTLDVRGRIMHLQAHVKEGVISPDEADKYQQ